MSKKFKICILSEYLSYVGGGERVYCSWANMFADILDYDVTIVSMEDWDKPFYKLSDKVKIASLKLRKAKFYQNGIKRKWDMITHYLHDRYIISRYLNENKFDFILGIATNINLILSTVNFSGCKIATEHTEYYAPSIIIRFLRKFLYKKFDYLTVLNEDDACLFKKINIPVSVAINPVDLNTKYDISQLNSKSIISIGSLSYQKDQFKMIDVMKIVHSIHPDWKLKIFGEGPLRNELEEYIKINHCDEYIDLPGITSDVYKELVQSSIFILTSKVEGFGLVIVEAMSAGLPCVSFDTLGPKMIINNGQNGILISSGNVEEFAVAVNKLIDSKELRIRLGKNGLNSSTQYSAPIVAEYWKDKFNLLNNSNNS